MNMCCRVLPSKPPTETKPDPIVNMDFIINTAKTTPLNLILLIPIAYLLWDIAFPRTILKPGAPIPSSYEESYLWKPKSHPPTMVWKKYSPITLQEFDGKRNPRILLAISRIVYDVTAGKSFYGPGQFGFSAAGGWHSYSETNSPSCWHILD